MQEVKLSSASLSDIPAISQLAHLVWNQYYPAIISKKQITYMLRLMYSDKSLAEQFNVKGHSFYFIRTERGNAGFISVNPEDNGGWFINKFYIDQTLAGKGLGEAAFRELLRLLSPEKLTLTVNRQNYKAVNFYFKCGFKIEKVADFDIGKGFFMNDFVMTWVKR
jgi:ribosomal protein S18 acetylase RimI-like enzyme